ncbi:MAG: hydrogenase maturation nickel metallochaperone HypA, partial [Candidatus Eremiobacteraeota bacterium]|nr:hydrogenase maturation nickel metallochaperone HypA [Candidatus Eremiobacteraeota bacterium]
DALLFAWDLTTVGTVADGSRLSIEEVPVAIMCQKCRAERVVPAFRLECPECGTFSAQIVRGRELDVSAMEVFDAASTG